jgi:type III secretion protein U
MNERDNTQAKTELPTRKRLRDLRKEGQVARSPDVAATVAVICGVAFLTVNGAELMQRLTRVLNGAVTTNFAALDNEQLLQWLRASSVELVWATMPMVVILVAVSALVGFLQVGPVFSTKQVQPQLSRVNPINGFKRVFSLHMLIELTKLVVKTAVLTAVVWLVVRNALPDLMQSHWLQTSGILPLTLRFLALLCWWAIVTFIALAAFDLWFQNWNFRRRNRMSVVEVRREHKETEGDPYVRSRRRQLHREVAEAAMLDSVRQASVVVVNPTHIAVALYYQAGETDLPVVVAKGEGELARAIRRVAEEEGIPIMHNVDLARRLRSGAPLNQYIPEDLIEPVAAVLRWARDMQRP